jgi:hypothetical protein
VADFSLRPQSREGREGFGVGSELGTREFAHRRFQSRADKEIFAAIAALRP